MTGPGSPLWTAARSSFLYIDRDRDIEIEIRTEIEITVINLNGLALPNAHILLIYTYIL
jgi:hypothetical protein